MSAPRLTQDLQHLIGDVYVAILALRRADVAAAPAITHPIEPSLQAVMRRCSYARAWIPSHLLESLDIR